MAYIQTWNPPVSRNRKVPGTELEKFQTYLQQKWNLNFDTYWELHDWSLKNTDALWEAFWHYFNIVASKEYEKVRVPTGPGLLEVRWFSGARLNFAENILRLRTNKTALVYTDESGYVEKISFLQLYQQVERLAAALRRQGLKKNDRVACYASNRLECVAIFLAASSIGAIFGGIHPNYPMKSAKILLNFMEPTFLFVEESHRFSSQIFDLFSNLEELVEGCTSLQKIVLLPAVNEKPTKIISGIKHCVYWDDFLRMKSVPPLIFEQLPPDHPVSIAFTSGTTGLPKGLMHGSQSLVSFYRDYVINWNLKEGDRILSDCPPGCSMWDYLFPALGQGISLLLYHGSLTVTNYWDFVGHHEVTFVFLTPIATLWMEEMGIFPGDKTCLSRLKTVCLTTSTAFKENFEYVRKVKNDVTVGNIYGTTETFGDFSAIHLNLPHHEPEIQVPALGVDVRCINSKGESVIGQRGEVVIASQYPAYPTRIWKDESGGRLHELYLKEHPGQWTVGDVGWINPKTRGLMVIGRKTNFLKEVDGVRYIMEDIYFAMHEVKEVRDCICISQSDGRILLFVKLQKGVVFTPDLERKISNTISLGVSPGCVPDQVIDIPDIPYNLLHKKMERVVREILETKKVPYVMNIENPESLQYYLHITNLQ